MLYYLFEWLNGQFDIPGTGVFHYITFRVVVTIIFSLFISLIIGKKIIQLLVRKLIGESIRTDGPESHKNKAGTPTMGGIIIIISIIIPVILWADILNMYVILLIISTLWIGAIGFMDDYIKVFKKSKDGLKGKFKIIGQVGLGLIVGITVVLHPDFKGKKGQVFQKVIKPSAELITYGFKSGDKLVAINGLDYTTPPEETDFNALTDYTIERGERPGHRQVLTIDIPQKEQIQVASELFLAQDKAFVTQTTIPFVKGFVFDYAKIAFWEKEPDGPFAKIIYILVVIFIVTAVSNSVNLTDGLDGLAAGTSAITAAALAVFCYLSGNIIYSGYLNIPYIPSAAEMVIVCAAMTGACIGFLWYNTHPAQVFMGDTGSLALGGVIAVVALLVKKELLIPIMCGIFLMESLSVMAQVAWFKYTKKRYGEGRRIFKMAPIHHHFELQGYHETKIVTRFWIVAILLALLAFATFKLR